MLEVATDAFLLHLNISASVNQNLSKIIFYRHIFVVLPIDQILASYGRKNKEELISVQNYED